MDPAEPVYHKKTLHSKRSFGKHPHKIDSPAYDASEEDNELTDDGASALSVSASSRPPAAARPPGTTSAGTSASPAAPAVRSRPKHHLASSAVLSDDGVDSPTYDGDIESSTTAGPARESSALSGTNTHVHSSSVSALTSPASIVRALQDDLRVPTVVTVLAPPSTASSSDGDIEPVRVITTLAHGAHTTAAPEPEPVAASRRAFNPAALTPADIQEFVRKAIDGELHRKYKINEPPAGRPVRIYADGVYDLFHFGHALQLRQAKLSFPDVYLLVGVNSDEQVKEHKFKCVMDHAERCEAARHCRWVDEVVSEAPWVIGADFIEKYAIDYVAHDEDPYMSAGHEDVYNFAKSQGKFIPTRRTPGVSTSSLLERIVKGYRKRDFDKKLEKMGRAELMAQGSDYEDKAGSEDDHVDVDGRRSR
ncbi:Nucleotidylyl transferase [Auriscalpium vulgare]|uniref:Nucleotidylyl transferase n=1 Tax=Auriscalpium vulgare TaxID=40419 RepID=A0ACB8RIB6_9AGAM|nr:Nucleotidylyl transferase [Auriscalpium vulgare]